MISSGVLEKIVVNIFSSRLGIPYVGLNIVEDWDSKILENEQALV